MVKIIPIAENISTLRQVRDKFNLILAADDHFFNEWFEGLPEITDREKETLDRIKRRYHYHREDGLLAEGAVNLVVLSPLLELAGFYDFPFKISAEPTVQIAVEDRDEIYRGRIDVLVLQDQFWILVVESKRTNFNVDIAIPQALTYMMANPNPDKPTFGMVTNGSYFMFIKLVKGNFPEYALSDDFSLYRRRNELYDVLRVLKQIGEAIAHSRSG
ncbi:type I restriction endonuclease [Coleofasciculus sp. H7-2]|uniref:type I restriction endonuclease n=1 Tax=Coleofasciculus sp. H7-2 TaxID=3351545 RepID=UPI00366CFFC4